MKTKNIRHQLFIREMITHGNRTKAYQAAYPECTSELSAYKSAGRLLSNPAILDEILQARAAISAEVMAGMKETIEEKCLSMARKRIWLARIMNGEKIFPQFIRRRGKIKLEYKVATPAQLLDAIELDTRLEVTMKYYNY